MAKIGPGASLTFQKLLDEQRKKDKTDIITLEERKKPAFRSNSNERYSTVPVNGDESKVVPIKPDKKKIDNPLVLLHPATPAGKLVNLNKRKHYQHANKKIQRNPNQQKHHQNSGIPANISIFAGKVSTSIRPTTSCAKYNVKFISLFAMAHCFVQRSSFNTSPSPIILPRIPQ